MRALEEGPYLGNILTPPDAVDGVGEGGEGGLAMGSDVGWLGGLVLLRPTEGP